jgi:DNA invertase Pin-like site-specific DNA recombinase
MSKPIGYSYVRFSSKRQARGSSLWRQTQDTVAGESPESWCARNGVLFDTATTFRDLGQSAYHGKKQEALYAFLEMVRQGRIRPGSYLLVEKIDRVSRKGVDEGYELCKQILKAGVSIVSLSRGRVYGPEAVKGLMKGALELQIELEQAWEYSDTLSKRIRAAWQDKHERAREGTLATKKMPPWLAAVGKGSERHAVIIPEKVAVVQRIYDLAVSGLGIQRIVGIMLDEKKGAPPLRGAWSYTGVRRLLANRAVLGEHQPMRGRGKSAVPDGDPIDNYFPAIIAPATFAKVQAALGARKNGAPRRRDSQHLNVFSGLLKDATSGTSYSAALRVERTGCRHLVLIANAKKGACHSFPYPVFEAALLSCLREINPKDLVPGNGDKDEVITLAAEVKRVEAKIEELEAELDHGDVAALARVLRREEAKQKELASQLAEAQLRAASPLSESWGEAQGILETIEAAPDRTDALLRLRVVLRRLVEVMMVLVVPRGMTRLCAVQVHFEGGRVRDYLILNRPPRSNQHGTTPGSWTVRSFAGVQGQGDFDLRRRENAHKLEAVLAAEPLDD